MQKVPQSFITDVLSKVQIEDIVSQHIELKKSGGNYFGLCPFHKEDSPSFSISPRRQTFRCFGCGATGNTLTFLRQYLNMSFIDALKYLCDKTGTVLYTSSNAPNFENKPSTNFREIHDILDIATRFYQIELKKSDSAIEYLKGRGVNGHTAKLFRIGYAPDTSWHPLASCIPDYESDLLVKSGLVYSEKDEKGQSIKRFDRFRGRIIFPIRSQQGNVIGFGGRILENESSKTTKKYLNSPESVVFRKGAELYGLFEAQQFIKDLNSVYVFEGYTDVLTLYQHGLKNCVATLGTACTNEHLQKLLRCTNHVIFCFDGDGPGLQAAVSALHIAVTFASDSRIFKFLFLPDQQDPDEYVTMHGLDRFKELALKSIPLSEMIFDVAKNGSDLDTFEGRARFAQTLSPLLQKLPEGFLKKQLVSRAAKILDLDAAQILG